MRIFRAYLLNATLLIRSGQLIGVDGLRSGLGRRLLEVVVVWSRSGVLEGLRRRPGVETLMKTLSQSEYFCEIVFSRTKQR